ncbi:site-2 protease family protein [Actinomadura rayongensis]|uniref:Site-2 protease family protein n=1 Tax=Actinomadura rayongensis TaxID=1429076 RepID=A0A6I4W322_9ACTN|nr:site-2 protease family protein [Actinomadura rayongensis]MXQ62815.1 site-2 protease family protein [Actinomadura rayongensis]
MFAHGRTAGRPEVRPSPLFLAIAAVTALCGLICWRYELIIERPARIAVFGFVVAGWVLTLCVHEFAHAYFAYRSGDHSVATRGYLTLNPLHYADRVLSFAIPVVFILLGGIGLPGGAVWLDRHAIRGRARQSLVSAAGPLANVLFAIMLSVVFKNFATREHGVFWTAIAFLGFLQVTAALLNILPIPGLDGFGIAEPYLPRPVKAWADQYGGFVFLGLLAVLWLVPAANEAFFDATYRLCDAIGLNGSDIQIGRALFEFWRD